MLPKPLKPIPQALPLSLKLYPSLLPTLPHSLRLVRMKRTLVMVRRG